MAEEHEVVKEMFAVRRKVCMVGDEAVGKTSLVRSFVHRMHDESYLRTVGTAVSKKVVDLPGTKRRMIMVIWDIMGRMDFMDLFREAYFKHVKGIVAVFDLTRPETLASLRAWIDNVTSTVGEVPTIIVGNKADLGQWDSLSDDGVAEFCDGHKYQFIRTSAKTGMNVDKAMMVLAMEMAALTQNGEMPSSLRSDGDTLDRMPRRRVA